MPVELTDEEAAAAKQAVALIRQLTSNPDARNHLERGIKVLKPEAMTSEDAAAAIRAPLEARLAEMEKRETERTEAAAKADKERAEAEALGRMETAFDRLRQNQGLTPEGEEKVRAIMKDRAVYDPEAAFALFERQNPRPVTEEGSSWTPSHWNYEKDAVEDTKALFANPDKWGDEMAGQVLLEERRRNGGDS